MMATWPVHYGPMGDAAVLDHVKERARSDGLPFGFAAFNGDQVMGTAALAAESFGADGDGPWLIGLAVAPAHRKQGIGAALIAGVADAAKEQGFAKILTTTQATGLFTRQGWAHLRTVEKADRAESWTVLRKAL